MGMLRKTIAPPIPKLERDIRDWVLRSVEVAGFPPFLSFLNFLTLLNFLPFLPATCPLHGKFAVHPCSTPKPSQVTDFAALASRHSSLATAFFYSPQSLQSKKRNSLKTNRNCIFYPPQIRIFPGRKIGWLQESCPLPASLLLCLLTSLCVCHDHSP